MLKFQVNDMTCGHCVGAVQEAVESADPSAKVSVDLARKEVRIDTNQAPEIFSKAIADAGYTGQLKG